MQTNRTLYIISFVILCWLNGCNGLLEDGLEPNDRLTYDQLNEPQAFGQLDTEGILLPGPNITSLLYTGANFYSDLFPYTGVMSDEFEWVENGNIVIYKEIYEDRLAPTNSGITSLWTKLHSYLAQAQEVIQRVNDTKWLESPEHQQIKQQSLWYAYFHQGNAYVNLFAYFNANQTDPGTLYLEGKSVSHEQTYDLALNSLEKAMEYGDTYQKRLTNSIIARAALLKEDWAVATEAVKEGLKINDEPLIMQYAQGSLTNGLGNVAGPFGRELSVPLSFKNLLTTESSIIRNPTTSITTDNGSRWVQTLYGQYDNSVVTDFTETNLIMAELIIRGFYPGNKTDAIILINEVLNYYDPSGQSATSEQELTLKEIELYRRIYLSWRGLRLLDLRRLPSDGVAQLPFSERDWKWFPVPEIEFI
ncbi:hypothetical protein [Xanthovirga aplysinae]|uniref:hypothetical protein n=1 Tax=Xanthovirga aplysinae TaxID=2529853 RepID=UPI0012BD7DC0|nr:hypothetical protein [Xanthovirga aplysinae]MTI31207.1 hypothetical protein [Xanthovirga aplysinae]